MVAVTEAASSDQGLSRLVGLEGFVCWLGDCLRRMEVNKPECNLHLAYEAEPMRRNTCSNGGGLKTTEEA